MWEGKPGGELRHALSGSDSPRRQMNNRKADIRRAKSEAVHSLANSAIWQAGTLGTSNAAKRI